MVNFILPADKKITIVEDTSYLLNNALHVNAVFSASGVVASGSDVLRVNLPNVGEHAELGWFDTGSDHSATNAATVKNTFSAKDGLHNITIQLGAATAASQLYHIEGWVTLP